MIEKLYKFITLLNCHECDNNCKCSDFKRISKATEYYGFSQYFKKYVFLSKLNEQFFIQEEKNGLIYNFETKQWNNLDDENEIITDNIESCHLNNIFDILEMVKF